MQPIDKRIIRFINKHHVFTLATAINNIPYCANCFYTFLEKENLFIFASEKSTKHIQDALKNQIVAGTIFLETKIIRKIQGIQFTGDIFELKDDLLKKGKKAYLKRFPIINIGTIIKDTTFWGIKIKYIKFTHNSLGFGKKLIWGK